jgi:hypothetical protein
LSDAGSGSLFYVTLGYGYTKTDTGEYHALPLSVMVNPLSWLLVSASTSYQAIHGRDTYYDEILVMGVPTPRVTSFTFTTRGVGDLSLSAWVNAADLLGQVFGWAPEPPSG